MAEKLVLMTSGCYSDYSVFGLIRIEESIYKEALEQINNLEKKCEKLDADFFSEERFGEFDGK